MAKLTLPLQLSNPDKVYKALVDLIDYVGDESGPSAMAALSLTLANQLGDDDVVLEAIELVRNAYSGLDDMQTGPTLITETLVDFFGKDAAKSEKQTFGDFTSE